MVDLLSAASLLMAIVGVLYGLWYGDITSSLTMALPQHLEDRQKPLSEARLVFWGKAFPLVLASASVTLVFMPPALTIIAKSFCGYFAYGYMFTYDPIATSLVLVEVFVCALFVHSLVRLVKLRQKIRQ